MTLAFSQELLGSKNYFLEKIWTGLRRCNICSQEDYFYYIFLHNEKFGAVWDMHDKQVFPKIHTLRESFRFQPGHKIHFTINNRSKNLFRFAPVVPCLRTQELEFKGKRVYIDGRELSKREIAHLLLNDGFTSYEDFTTYFEGKKKLNLIHWTNFKY